MTDTATAAIAQNDPDGPLRLIQAAQDSLSDTMVERLAITGSNVLEVVDKLNDEDTKDAVIALIEGVGEMHRSGAMTTLFDLVALLHGARAAMTDSMVERLFVFVEHMMTNLATEEIATLAHNAKEAMQEAADELATRPSEGGMLATVRMLSKPETQRALTFLLGFACKMQKKSVDPA
ncbi:DUF1641 domain-containing protein [Varunaivibrio sulfuroxidans]|uniref:DUF1641 domain-containing protein n=1 Tax=Varunaivibrio sulfuroxidans TaxID=1773489 RepID=A0A4V2UNE0_9PROT|nr:DUF1641 domain-containing protein [Varunaivibrio sulfuroxidans]TCS60621.1 hypothetical protein EDD55_11096 [Varunaivibrio sulfuroxidans]WES30110.1 DUF1641 domain-containing protein [Varunaivibrio sulfuroxidans]